MLASFGLVWIVCLFVVFFFQIFYWQSLRFNSFNVVSVNWFLSKNIYFINFDPKIDFGRWDYEIWKTLPSDDTIIWSRKDEKKVTFFFFTLYSLLFTLCDIMLKRSVNVRLWSKRIHRKYEYEYIVLLWHVAYTIDTDVRD